MNIPILSILLITTVAWIIKSKMKLKICPICAGVFLTWLWMLGGLIVDELPVSYQLPSALLMGGTVVGLMSTLEKYIKPNFILIWKTVFVLCGFLAAYSLILSNWIVFGASVVLAAIFTFGLKTVENNPKSKNIKELEEKMKNCC